MNTLDCAWVFVLPKLVFNRVKFKLGLLCLDMFTNMDTNTEKGVGDETFHFAKFIMVTGIYLSIHLSSTDLEEGLEIQEGYGYQSI